MVDKSVQYIPGPKYSGNDPNQAGIAFSPNLKMMALIQKNEENSKDMIGLYDISITMDPRSKGQQKWICMHQFFPDTFDAQNLIFT